MDLCPFGNSEYFVSTVWSFYVFNTCLICTCCDVEVCWLMKLCEATMHRILWLVKSKACTPYELHLPFPCDVCVHMHARAHILVNFVPIMLLKILITYYAWASAPDYCLLYSNHFPQTNYCLMFSYLLSYLTYRASHFMNITS